MENIENKGCIYVISGPSGVGKGTLMALLLDEHPEIALSVSVTTRKPRLGEIDGVDYYFTSKENFQNLAERDKFLEWAEFAGNFYGTYASTVEKSLTEGKEIALEIDVNGALQVKNKIKEAILIFIEPPSIEALQSRLFKRSTESQEVIEKRLSIVKQEFEMKNQFDYSIINEELDEAFKNLESIVLAERCKIKK